VNAEKGQVLTDKTVLLLAACCGVVIANIYYNQALLVDMARSIDPDAKAIGLIPTLTQVGFSLGLLFLLPLGDTVERRGLIVRKATALSAFLLMATFSPNLIMLCLSSLLIGVMATIAQQIIPFGAQLAGPGRSGKVVGRLMSGLLLGVLLARAVGGVVSAHGGWRVMLGVASVATAGAVIVLRRSLPVAAPTAAMPYPHLLRSLWQLVKTQPVLRQSSMMGAMFFAAFSVFWSTMALLLEGTPFHYSGDIVGLYGLLGAAGILASPVAGRMADHGAGRKVLWMASILAVVAYFVLGFSGHSGIGIAIGVVLLDLGVWAAQTANQHRIFAIAPEARSRLNSVYMVCYFAGGAFGSAVGSVAWRLGGWHAVTWVGGILAAVPSLVLALSARRKVVAANAAGHAGA
jgi:predicted MFS family arabinose efflux permease